MPMVIKLMHGIIVYTVTDMKSTLPRLYPNYSLLFLIPVNFHKNRKTLSTHILKAFIFLKDFFHNPIFCVIYTKDELGLMWEKFVQKRKQHTNWYENILKGLMNLKYKQV